MMARLLLAVALPLLALDDGPRILRPADRSALPVGAVDVVATAPGGKLEVDGREVATVQPFPDVWHATFKAAEGMHTLALVWPGGRKEVRFFAGVAAPEGFQAFRPHPPAGHVACTQCHELSSRGRFRFKTGACFDCHAKDAFAKPHSHEIAVLAECGMCHNAHGSTAKAHLLYGKETACKQCHD